MRHIGRGSRSLPCSVVASRQRLMSLPRREAVCLVGLRLSCRRSTNCFQLCRSCPGSDRFVLPDLRLYRAASHSDGWEPENQFVHCGESRTMAGEVARGFMTVPADVRALSVEEITKLRKAMPEFSPSVVPAGSYPSLTPQP
jgi:hypothetical protein